MFKVDPAAWSLPCLPQVRNIGTGSVEGFCFCGDEESDFFNEREMLKTHRLLRECSGLKRRKVGGIVCRHVTFPHIFNCGYKRRKIGQVQPVRNGRNQEIKDLIFSNWKI
jgi:hypothetical protein